MISSTVTQKGQVTIPKEIRDRLDIRQGERVMFVPRGNEVVLKVVRGNILDLKGSIKAQKHPEDFAAIRRSVRRTVGAKADRHD